MLNKVYLRNICNLNCYLLGVISTNKEFIGRTNPETRVSLVSCVTPVRNCGIEYIDDDNDYDDS